MAAADVTQLLVRWSAGDGTALEELMPLVYEELRRMARRSLRREPSPHTLQPTALVHEAYLRLVNQSRADWQNRAHFFGIAAQLMRRILIDHARRHRASKRGGGVRPVTLVEPESGSADAMVDLLALNDALTALAAIDPAKGRLVELRFFGGLSVDEVAEVLESSPRTVAREWRVARAWLHSRMNGASPR